MSFLFRPAHNIEHYNEDLACNHDHQVNHLANEVAHNLRFAAFGCHSQERLAHASTELAFDAQHLNRQDFQREVAAIQNKLPNRDFQVMRSPCGDIQAIVFNGARIF